MDRAEILVAIANEEDEQALQGLIDLYSTLPPESEEHESRVREIYLDREIRALPLRPADRDPDWPGLTSDDRAIALQIRNAKHARDRLGKILERNRLTLQRFKRDLKAAQSDGRATDRLSTKIALLEDDIQSRENRSEALARMIATNSERLGPAARTVIAESEAGSPPALQDIDTLKQRVRALQSLLSNPNDLSTRDAKAAQAEITRVERRIASIMSDPVALQSPERTAVVERPMSPLHLKAGDRIRLDQDATGETYTVGSRSDRRIHLIATDGKARYVDSDGMYPTGVRLETVPYHEMLADKFERGPDGGWFVRGMVGDDEARVSNPNLLSDLSGFFGGDSGATVEQQSEAALAASAHPEDRMNALVDAWVDARIAGDGKRMRKIETVLETQRTVSSVPGQHVLRTDGSLDVPPVIPNNLRSLTDDEVRALYRGARDYLTIPLRDVFRLAWEIRSRGLRLEEGEL